MNLHIITHQIAKPLTGGDHYNIAFMEGAKNAGWEIASTQIEDIQGNKIKPLYTNFKIWHIIYSLPKNTVLIIDAGSLTWCILGIILNRFVKRKHSILLLHHFPYYDTCNPVTRFTHIITAKIGVGFFDKLHTVSLWSKSTFFKLSKKNINAKIISPYVKLLANGFEINNKHNEIPKLLSVAMLSDRKNIHNVIIALSHVKTPFKYDIIGKAGTEHYLSQLKELVDKYKLNDSVTFHGRVGEEELVRRYQNASIFILVSYIEGYGMAYTDAMAYGLPIVASNRAAVPELIVHEQNGLLCDPDDPIAIANAIERFCTDRDFSTLIGKRNREKFATLSSRSDFVEQSRIYFDKLKTELL